VGPSWAVARRAPSVNASSMVHWTSGDQLQHAHHVRGFDIICFAYLVLRSSLLPRAIAVLLAIDGVAYLIYSFADLLETGLAAYLVPGSSCPHCFVKDRCACGCSWPVWMSIDGRSVWLRRHGFSPRKGRHWHESCPHNPCPLG